MVINGNGRRLLQEMIGREGWVTAGQLAGALDVSERSVKSYIAELKNGCDGVVLSSQKGYRADAALARRMLDESAGNLPQTSRERAAFILSRILTNDAAGGRATDLYALAEEIFVSYETLRKDMAKVRKRLMDFELCLATSGTEVALEGREFDKRRILSSILYEEFSRNVMSLEIVERAFPGFDLRRLQEIVLDQCKQFRYFVNEYALFSLLLDLVIGIDRIRRDRISGAPRGSGTPFGVREQSLAEGIAHGIEDAFGIRYDENEREGLTIILMSHLTKMDYATLDAARLEEAVGDRCVRIVERIRQFLKTSYFIETDKQDFLVMFTLHIRNLLIRLESGNIVRNPLLEHIRNTCPLIYECAVGVAEILTEMTGFAIDEDEIAYLALHIGGNLETQRPKERLVRTVVLFPQYYDFSNRMTDRLKERFGDSLEITDVVTSAVELRHIEKTDLVVTTVPLRDPCTAEWALVTPFLVERDFDAVEERIQSIILRKKKARLKMHLMHISNPQFFFRNRSFADKAEAVRFMTDILRQEGYVDERFEDEVFERERQASTAFEHIAVPHSMKMNANRTGMFVLINERRPIQWDGHQVSIVLLFAINREERAIFHDVFDNLIVLLLNKANAARVAASGSYIEFIEAVVDCFQ